MTKANIYKNVDVTFYLLNYLLIAIETRRKLKTVNMKAKTTIRIIKQVHKRREQLMKWIKNLRATLVQ